MKKIMITTMLIIGLMSQASASETESDYVTPILIGGGVVVVGILTGGLAYVVAGVAAGTAVSIGSATVVGGSYVATLDD